MCAVSLPVPAALPPGVETQLGTEERARAASFRVRADRNAYVAAHVLLARLAGEVTGKEPASWRFEPDARGKPHLAGLDEKLYASLSHTRGAVAVGLCRDVELGVDIETRFDAFADLAGDVLTAREQQAVFTSDDPAQGFTRLWTRKEALTKAFGLGLSVRLSRIDVLDPQHLHLPPEMTGEMSLTDVACPAPFAMAVAARSPHLEMRCFEAGLEHLTGEAGRVPHAA